ncbi:MAG: hypothetical protein H7321_08495 [Bacteroidia bacterium]|nr:hypothetical protein [Bacteroidia bacterium]
MNYKAFKKGFILMMLASVILFSCKRTKCATVSGDDTNYSKKKKSSNGLFTKKEMRRKKW